MCGRIHDVSDIGFDQAGHEFQFVEVGIVRFVELPRHEFQLGTSVVDVRGDVVAEFGREDVALAVGCQFPVVAQPLGLDIGHFKFKAHLALYWPERYRRHPLYGSVCGCTLGTGRSRPAAHAVRLGLEYRVVVHGRAVGLGSGFYPSLFLLHHVPGFMGQVFFPARPQVDIGSLCIGMRLQPGRFG